MHPNRKYHVNTNYFDAIDSEGKSYWLGFLYADGVIHPNRPEIYLALAKRDHNHIRKFKRHLNSGHPIKPVNGLMRISIGSSELKSSLISHGIKPQKSRYGKPCTLNIPEVLLVHFWRGVFDGDGWVCYNKRKGRNRGKWQVGVCGTLETVVGFSDFIYEKLHYRPYIDQRDLSKNFARISYNALKVEKEVCNLLYNGASVFLDRKKTEIDSLRLYRVYGEQ
jgi:hypothetical protein